MSVFDEFDWSILTIQCCCVESSPRLRHTHTEMFVARSVRVAASHQGQFFASAHSAAGFRCFCECASIGGAKLHFELTEI
jgi:hypothetical protein